MMDKNLHLQKTAIVICEKLYAKGMNQEVQIVPAEAKEAEEDGNSLEIWRKYMNSTYPMSAGD